MATRESYTRVWAQYKGRELSIGLEQRDGDIESLQQDLLEAVAMDSLVHYQLDRSSVEAAERQLKGSFPSRAYFVEIDSGPSDVRRGVQVFQPYGLPRTLDCPAPGEHGLQAFATFGTWDGPGHRPGCDALPRTARGCYCGGDHQ